MLALLLVAGAVAHPAPRPAQPNRSVEQRVALLEARQLLESQALWGMQASLPTETLKALSDLDLHLARDQEQDEKVKTLENQVQQLEQRLQNIELMLQDRTNVEGSATRVVQPQASAAPARPTAVPVVSAPLVLNGKVKGAKAQAKKSPKAKQQRYAER